MTIFDILHSLADGNRGQVIHDAIEALEHAAAAAVETAAEDLEKDPQVSAEA